MSAVSVNNKDGITLKDFYLFYGRFIPLTEDDKSLKFEFADNEDGICHPIKRISFEDGKIMLYEEI